MDKELICEVNCIHEEITNEVKKEMLAIGEIQSLSAIFKAFGDPTRLRILHCLMQAEMCVCDLCFVLEMSQSAVSHQLRVLRNLRLVKHRKEGKNVFYSLDDDHIFKILAEGLEHVRHV
ncbi:MAG: ArsR family transcriptional regulator [Clostridiaceae bacterium BRH_c20a]|nr:MAG: ArsR family transcriptional regulator [Clostridiaceae bacterium BRH_c20a]